MEKEEADDTAGQEHRDDAGIEPAQAFALIQPGIDEDDAQAIEGHAGIVRLVQQPPDAYPGADGAGAGRNRRT